MKKTIAAVTLLLASFTANADDGIFIPALDGNEGMHETIYALVDKTHYQPIKKIFGSDAAVLVVPSIQYTEDKICTINVFSTIGAASGQNLTLNGEFMPTIVNTFTKVGITPKDCGSMYAKLIERNGAMLQKQINSFIKGA